MEIDILKIKRKLLVKYPTFGSIVANATFISDMKTNTASTDGKIIFYNPEYVNKLSVDERTFLFAHEVCHIAFDHIFRSKGKVHRIWNIATDAVINAFLKNDGLPMIKGGVDIEDAINYDAEELYEKLLKEYEKDKQNQSSNSEQVGHDDHTIWSEAIKRRTEESNNKTGEIKTDVDKNKIFDEIEKLSKQGEKDSFRKNSKEKKKMLDELKDSLSKPAGKETNSLRRYVSDVGMSYPLIDWKNLLRQVINVDVDWSYKNATIEEGVLTPNLVEIPEPETEIVLDTSGSVDETLLRNFLRECKNILLTSKVSVGCFDTKFYGFHEIRSENDIDTMTLQGGGGTNFDVAVNAFSNRVENKIIFTDGHANMPKKRVDVIWIVFGGKKINPVGGTVINISDDDYRKLSSNSYGRKR